MIKKLIKKVKDFWYSPECTVTIAIVTIMSILTAMLVRPVTMFTYIGAIVIVTIGGLIYILQIAQEDENE